MTGCVPCTRRLQLRPRTGRSSLTLGRVITTGRALVAALKAGKYTQVAALDRAFQQAAATSTSISAQREQIAAVKAYDARVRAVNSLAVAVDRERSRLQKTLG